MTAYLVDTNVLLRIVDGTYPLQSIARSSEQKLRRGGHDLSVATQNCIEFWNVATRPVSRNGLGLLPARADIDLGYIEQTFRILPDTPAVYSVWRQLVVNYGVSGIQVHDAHLVAAMLANRITHILTFNTGDFARYSSAGIVVVDPATV